MHNYDPTPWLKELYRLGDDLAASHLRSHTNDIFLVSSPQAKHILKLYGVNWRTGSEIKYEAELVNHLARGGLRIANVVTAQDGEKTHLISTPRGNQYTVLFEHSKGRRPEPPFSNKLYRALGRGVAQMHNLSDNFTTDYDRPLLNLEYLIDEPLKMSLPLLTNRLDRLFLQKLADTIEAKLDELGAYNLDWGPVHGDATLENLDVDEKGQVVFYDFDSGGPGWRSGDLPGLSKNNPKEAEKFASFKEGYTEIRPLSEADQEFAPYIAAAWLIWGVQLDLERRMLSGTGEPIANHLSKQIQNIQKQIRFPLS